MTTIQCWNRQDVHKRQNDAQECGHHPESVPIPHRREQAAQGSETTQTLGSFLGEHILHIAYVASQDIPAILETGSVSLSILALVTVTLEIVEIASDILVAEIVAESLSKGGCLIII